MEIDSDSVATAQHSACSVTRPNVGSETAVSILSAPHGCLGGWDSDSENGTADSSVIARLWLP